MKKKEVLKSFCISFILTCCIMLVLFEKIDYKVEIDYPPVYVSMHQVSGEQVIELDAKRAFENKVYANIERTGIHYDNLRIGFICDSGTEFYASNIRLAVGNLVVSKITSLNIEGVKLNELRYEERADGIWILKTMGDNPYIEIQNFRAQLRSHLEIYLLITFVLILFCVMVFCRIFIVIKQDLEQSTFKLDKCEVNKKTIVFWCISILGFVLFSTIVFWFREEVSLYMNMAEVLFWGFASVFVYIQLARRTRDIKTLLWCWGIIVIFLGFSVYKLTTYLTVDEYQNIVDTYNMNGEDLRHWYSNVSRANYLIMGTLWKVIPKIVISDNLPFEQLAKLLHWLCGIGGLGIIASVAEKKLVAFCEGKKRAITYTVLLVAILSIPVVVMALKNYNYDMFSMLFGVLGILETIAYVKDKRKSDAIFAVCILTLALSEKLIVLPAWLICLVVIVAEYAEDKRKGSSYLIGTGTLCLGVIVVMWLSQKYVLEFLRDSAPINTIGDTLEAICEFPYMGIRTILRLLQIELDYSIVLIVTGVALIIGVFICAIIYTWVKEKVLKVSVKNFNNWCGIGLGAFLCVGVIAAFIPNLNITESRIDYLLFYLGNFVKAYPTLILAGVIGSCIMICKNKIEKEWLAIALVFNTFIIAIFYIIVKDDNFTHVRYANVYILSFVVIAFVVGICNLEKYFVFSKDKLLGVGAVVLLTLGEVSGSQPAYSYFIPVWCQTMAEQNEYGVPLYWGEQWEVAGAEVKEYCRINNIELSEITMYIGYPGGKWLNSEGITSGDKKWMWKMGECSATEKDFYVFETSAVSNRLIPAGLPDESIEPLITIEYRGAVAARIYRGSDLQSYFGGE